MPFVVELFVALSFDSVYHLRPVPVVIEDASALMSLSSLRRASISSFSNIETRIVLNSASFQTSGRRGIP
ncbi:MAG: hypothetical protein QW328_06920 [Nitrososphaerota archaeon]